MAELDYFLSLVDKRNYTYSVDMVRVTFELRRDALSALNQWIEAPTRTDIKSYPQNLTSYKYRYLYLFDYGRDCSSMTLGFCFNGDDRDDCLKGFLEFNPNKTMKNPQCELDLKAIFIYCVDRTITRWDMACDMPIERELVHMCKDNRYHELSEHSYKDRTEYLGIRNTPGRVKIYNKQLESSLDRPLTRCEITFGKVNEISSQFDRFVPEMFTSDIQGKLSLGNFTDTEKVLLELISASGSPEYYLSRIGRKTKEKLKPYIIGSDEKIELSRKCVTELCIKLNDYIKAL